MNAVVRELGAKLDAIKGEEARIAATLTRVEEATWARGYKRVRDVQAMADAVLAGGLPPADPKEATPEGLAALSSEQLADLKAGLQQKAREAADSFAWVLSRHRLAAREVLKEAAATIAREYAAKLKEAARLHVLLDAANSLVGQGIVPTHDWRQERWLAPEAGLERKDVISEPHQSALLADFASGAGTSQAAEQFKAAVLAASGHPAW